MSVIDNAITSYNEAAKKALEAADCVTLHRLYKQSVERNTELWQSFNTLVREYADKNDHIRSENPNTVDAMKEVALAAIDMAKSATTQNKT